MDFREVKDFCKYAGPGVCCPATFKNCNKDNCPMCFSNMNEDDCDSYCPIVDKYRGDVRRARIDFKNAGTARKQLEKDYQQLAEAFHDQLDQFAALKNELDGIVENSVTLVNSALYDLRDKLKESIKRLEP